MNFTNRTFKDETVNLDSNSFQGCKFIRCFLVYEGSGVTSVIDCHFDAPIFSFTGAAKNTLGFLTGLYHAGGKQIIEATFDNIRRGVNPVHLPPDPKQN